MQFYYSLLNYIEETAPFISKYKSSYAKRIIFQFHYSFAIPTDEAIRKINKLSIGKKIVEVGAGRGLWAFLLATLGTNITCYDNLSWFSNCEDLINLINYPYYPVTNQNHTDIDYSSFDILLLIWPPRDLDNKMASETLSLFTGNILVYVGEIHEILKFEDLSTPNPYKFDKDDYWVRMNKPAPKMNEGELYIFPQTGDFEFHKILHEKWIMKEKISIPNLISKRKKHMFNIEYKDAVYIFERR